MTRMPAIFIGHGSPMNILEDNTFTRKWAEVARWFPRPAAILAVSAHWFTHGNYVCTTLAPQTIHDFYGFPRELYEIDYPAPGAPGLADEVYALLNGECTFDSEYGLDHGAWCVLRAMYPEADIPVCQLSVNGDASPHEVYEIGTGLSSLRDEGVLVLGSGNIVHNLYETDFDRDDGYPWARAFDDLIHDAIQAGDHNLILDISATQSRQFTQAAPSPEHFLPLLYVLGATGERDAVQVFNRQCTLGSVSMTSYLFGA